MKVFLAATSLLAAYGGPAYSVSGLAMALADAGLHVGLWAPDQSAATALLLPAKSPVQRLVGTESEALNKFGRPDVLHDNGIWLPHNHRLADLAERGGIPRLVSTRGMLEPWAMSHKRWKKRIAWWLYQRRDLMHAKYHHATAEAEAKNLQHLRLDIPVSVIPNGVDVPEAERAQMHVKCVSKNKIALFLGRIYPVKGLPMLIQAWARVRPIGWQLKVAGPDEAGHRAEVEQQVSAAGLSDVITFVGLLQGQAKASALYDADLFVLPTYSESFGMVVAEALAHQLPVLTTTGAPWPMLEERGCGWWVTPTVDGITEGLRHATSLDAATLEAMGSRGRALVAEDFGWESVAKKFVTLYADILET